MLPNEKELSKYRLERAREDLHTAEVNLSNGLYKGAVNRSYYAIFHAIRAVNIMDGFDASKHSSVIAHFNQYHVHTGDFEKDTYKIIDSAYRIREKSDYSDFFIVSREEAEEQYKRAVMFLKCVEAFIGQL
jgi:uncharacterized protein (UPF0332 family)